MSAPTTFLLTPSTSLLLIRDVTKPTVVYLSTFVTPNYTVTIRDTTGSALIQTNPVYLSTVGAARFLDGTASYSLNKPYGLVNVAFRNSSYWQILHTSGIAPSTSAATIGRLNVSSLSVSFLSSVTKEASSLTVTSFYTPNPIVLNSEFVLTNLSTPSLFTIQSTLSVYGDTFIQKGLYVSGPTTLQSSVQTNFLYPIAGITRVVSSIGIGTTLSVGGVTSVAGQFQTFSTNTVDSLQVQQSTGITLTTGTLLQVNSLVSSLLGFTSLTSFTGDRSLLIQQEVSSLTGGISTSTLDVGGTGLFLSGLSTFGNSIVYSDVFLASSLQIRNSAHISSILSIENSAFVSSLSSVRFQTIGSLSTNRLFLPSTALFSTGLSTALLQGFGQISIGTDFYSPGIVSSLTRTNVGGSLAIDGSAEFAAINVSSSVGIGGSLDIQGVSYLDALTIRGDVRTTDDFHSLSYTTVEGNVGVAQSMFVNSNLTIKGASFLNSFAVNSFLLSNLSIYTSSPFLDFTASTLQASTIESLYTHVGRTDPPFLSRNALQATTVQGVFMKAEETTVTNAYTSNFLWGENQTSLASASKPQFVVSTELNFSQGLSSQSIRVDSFIANSITATFLGDGANISNVAVPYANISSLITAVSTLSSCILFLSSASVSSFTGLTTLDVRSSLITPTLRIEGSGFPLRGDVNHILTMTSTSLAVNRVLYFDTLQQTVGVNLSSPAYTLDVSGLFFTTNLYFSSFVPIVQTSTGSSYFSSLFTRNAIVRDSLRFATNGLDFQSVNPTTGQQTMKVQVLNNLTHSNLPSPLGIYSLPSSIAFGQSVYVRNDLQKVQISKEGRNITPLFELTLTDTLATKEARISTLTLGGLLESRTFESPSLLIGSLPFLSVNSISTTVQNLYLNQFVTLQNTSTPRVGIHTQSPTTSLDIQGTAYFSSLFISETLYPQILSMGSQFV